jgi:DNA (cytosine-5)-methyltransferase 1
VSDVLYNDIDPFCCAVLRERISEGWIDGTVVERDVRELQPSDVAGFRRVHLFAGIGAGELACQLAEWPDDWSLWTGGFPCQDASSANPTGGGIHGERTGLYREFVRLAATQRPLWIVAENVGGLVSRGIDIVIGDFEREGYACWPLVVGAAEVGAPHLRDRLWFVFNDRHAAPVQRHQIEWREPNGVAARVVALADASGSGSVGRAEKTRRETRRQTDRQDRPSRSLAYAASARCDVAEVGRTDSGGEIALNDAPRPDAGLSESERGCAALGHADGASSDTHAARRASWRAARQSGWWRAEPDVGRVAHGVPARVDRLRSLGNAQVPLVLASVLVGIQRAVAQERGLT